MRHVGTVPLETQRLKLRRFEPRDAAAMFTNWAADPEVCRYLAWKAHADLSVTEAVLADWVSAYNQESEYHWAIELKPHYASEDVVGQPIGSIGAVGLKEDLRSVAVGYCMGRQWWGQGIMSEALSRLLEFLFDEVGVGRVEANHAAPNPASGKVMEKCGMVQEGRFRERFLDHDGNLVDDVWYAILARDYQKK